MPRRDREQWVESKNQQEAFVKPPDVRWGPSDGDGWEVVLNHRWDESAESSTRAWHPDRRSQMTQTRTFCCCHGYGHSHTIYSWTVRVYISIEEEIERLTHLAHQMLFSGAGEETEAFFWCHDPVVARSGPVTQCGMDSDFGVVYS